MSGKLISGVDQLGRSPSGVDQPPISNDGIRRSFQMPMTELSIARNASLIPSHMPEAAEAIRPGIPRIQSRNRLPRSARTPGAATMASPIQPRTDPTSPPAAPATAGMAVPKIQPVTVPSKLRRRPGASAMAVPIHSSAARARPIPVFTTQGMAVK